ncbi:MAG: hypothetical protein ACYSUI_15085 [Planctomycetota bacterium]|jgi:hypothetical protein
MLLYRRVLFVLTLLGVSGSISVTLGYGLYLRSDWHRRGLERDVSTLLDLSVSIGRVRALTTDRSAFYDIKVDLPNRDAQVFRCDTAVWHDESRNSRPRFALDLIDGWLLVGTHQWAEADYQAFLRSGLGHDFAALNLRRVHLDDIDLEWRHPDIALTMRDAVGEIRYDDDGTGRASLIAYDLNGQPVAEPIKIVAHFTPGAGLVFHEARLDVPVIPFSRLGLDRLLRSRVEHGTFRGRLGYRESEGHEYVELSGSVEGARLEELTEPVIGGPFRGQVDVVIDQAVFVDRRLDSLRFRGRLGELNLTELVPLLRHSSLESQVHLRVHQAALRGRTIEYLSAAGQATDLSLETVTGLWGQGTITGRLLVEIHALQIVDHRLQHAEIDLIAVPPDDAPGTIDRELLDQAARELIGLDLSSVLPERVEYASLGAKLVIDGEVLRVRGTHGTDGRTILTVRALGRDLPIVKELDRTFPIGPLLAQIREKLATYDVEDVREWWEHIHVPPEQ